MTQKNILDILDKITKGKISEKHPEIMCHVEKKKERVTVEEFGRIARKLEKVTENSIKGYDFLINLFGLKAYKEKEVELIFILLTLSGSLNIGLKDYNTLYFNLCSKLADEDNNENPIKPKGEDNLHNYFNQFTLVGDPLVNNITVMLLFIFIIGLLLLITKKNLPSGYQSLTEQICNNLTGLSKENMEELKYFPILFSLFFLLVSSNVLGLLPYNITVTSLIIVTFGISLTVVISASFIGFGHYWEDYCSLFMPGGAPLILSPLLVIIETISYASRAISLGVRLAANLSAGHLLFVILASFGFQFINSWLIIFPVLILFFITLLEMAVAGIQAYVFCLLTAIYLGDALKLH